MDKKQEKLFEGCKAFRLAQHSSIVNWHDHEVLIRAAWEDCLDANGIEAVNKACDSACPQWHHLVEYDGKRQLGIVCSTCSCVPDWHEGRSDSDIIAIIKEIASSVKDIAKKLEPEVINVEAKEWTPKEGYAVFCKDMEGIVYVGKVFDFVENRWRVEITPRYPELKRYVDTNDIKPFSPSAIGKPWSEI